MRLKDIKKVGTYLWRSVKNPLSKQSRAALGRYGREFLLCYLKRYMD